MSSEGRQHDGEQQEVLATPVGLRDAVAAMRASYAAARASIEATADARRAFQLATRFRDQVDELVGDAADLRAQMVGRVWESEQLSLAELAKRIGVSKSRADQFIKSAKAAKSEQEEA